MATAKRSDWVAGIYRPHAQIAKLWRTLADGQPYNKQALSDSIAVKVPANRWYWMNRDGLRHNNKKPDPLVAH